MTETEYLCRFIGIKYTWGGKTPEQGYDCSGIRLEGWRSHRQYKGPVINSQQMYNYEIRHNLAINSSPVVGCTLYFGENIGKIGHVALAISHDLMLEAGGEGSESTTWGFVRIRPISSRKDLVACLKPITMNYDC